jgi:hypothetical protein
MFIAALWLLAAAAPAGAVSYDEAVVYAGPALAGQGVAWVGVGPDDRFGVKRAPLDGVPQTLYTVERHGYCTFVEDLAASAELVAVKARGTSAADCPQQGYGILVNDLAGGSKKLGNNSDGCMPLEMDVDGTTVATAHACRTHAIVLHDIAKGTTKELGVTLPEHQGISSVRLAGRYVAYVMGGVNFSWAQVVVWDHEADKEVYRVDGDDLQPYSSGRVELLPDGRILVGARTGSDTSPGVRYGWASPAEPTLHAIPGLFDHPHGRLGFTGELIAVPLGSSADGGIVGLDGTVRQVIPEGGVHGSVDFDGTRQAWTDRRKIYNEAFPYTPPPQPAPYVPVAPPRPVAPAPAPASAPVAKAAALKATSKARALKGFSGSAADADGDLLMVRVGLVRVAGKKCQTLQRNGRLKASKPVGGKCVPASFFIAAGTKAWKFKLRKRLPAGRYLLYVQAVDAAGHAQATFTKSAGNLRSFTLR